MISCYEDGTFELPNIYICNNELQESKSYCLILSNPNNYNYVKILIDKKIYYMPKYELESLEEI